MPPPEDTVKINCDGAFNLNNRSGGWGFLIRTWDGGVIASGYGKLDNVGEAFHTEIIACLQALNRAADLGIQKVILETDAVMVVHAVNSSDFDLCSAGGLIWELKDMLINNFTSYVVVHNPRSCNSAAHSLAAQGVFLISGATPVQDSIPRCTRILVANDLASVNK
jgi:ribonuclease HI